MIDLAQMLINPLIWLLMALFAFAVQEKCTRLTGEKVYPFTTTLPQQVAADILNFLTALELSH